TGEPSAVIPSRPAPERAGTGGGSHQLHVADGAELLAPARGGVGVDVDAEDGLLVGEFADDRAVRVDGDRAARVAEEWVTSDAVDAEHVRLVLDRAGDEQRAPVHLPRLGPVRPEREQLGP